jgi:hypothetical protein
MPIFALISLPSRDEEKSGRLPRQYPASAVPLPRREEASDADAQEKRGAREGDELFFVAGGGGAARTGVKNIGQVLRVREEREEGVDEAEVVETVTFGSEAPGVATAHGSLVAVGAARTLHLLERESGRDGRGYLRPAWSASFDTLLHEGRTGLVAGDAAADGAADDDNDDDDDEISSLAFAPAGDKLAVGTRNGEFVLLDLATLRPTHTLANHAEPLSGLSFSPSGALLALVTDAKVSLLSLSLCDTIVTLRPEGRAAAPAPGQPLVRVRGFHWLTDDRVLLGEMRPSVRRSPGFSRLRLLSVPPSPAAGAPRTISNLTAHSAEHHTALVTGVSTSGPLAVTVTAQGNAALFSLRDATLRRLNALSVFPDDSVATAVALAPHHSFALVGSANRLIVRIPLTSRPRASCALSGLLAFLVLLLAVLLHFIRDGAFAHVDLPVLRQIENALE